MMTRADRFAVFVLRGCAVMCAAVLGLAVLRSASSIEFYLAPLVGLGLLAFVGRLRGETRVNVSLATVAVVAALGIAELALYVTDSGHYQPSLDFEAARIREARRQGVPYDLRSRIEVVDQLNAQGMPAVARMPPGDFLDSDGIATQDGRLFPLSGISRSSTVACNESGEWIVVESDEHGLRNPLGQYLPGVVDVVFVGDSYTYGTCVDDGQEVAGLLRRTYERVLNLGYGGNGPLIELASLEEYGTPFAPRNVLWLYWEGNDLINLRSESRSVELMKYMDRGYSQGLLGRQEEIDRLLRERHDEEHDRVTLARNRRWRCVVSLCGVRALVSRSSVSGASFSWSTADLPVALLGEVLREARDRVTAWGGSFYFVYVPDYARYHDDVDQDQHGKRAEVLREIEASGIELIDFHDILGAHPDPTSLFPFRLRGHFTPEGYALLAQQIEAKLRDAAEKSP